MEGFTTIESHAGPVETMDRLEAAIKSRGITVFARINHASLATRAGLNLRPTEVIIFGNPRGGTPLMQAKQSIGIDLPLKALVWQDESGKTLLSYHEPRWLAQRHGIEGLDDTIEALTKALVAIATEAAGGSPGEGTGSAQGTSTSQRASSDTPPARLSVISLIARFLVIAAIIAAIAALFLYAGGWLTPRALTPARFADGFEQAAGRHPGFRRNHAKGVCVSGYFESNGQGATLSKSSVFQPGRTVAVRWSFTPVEPFVSATASDAASADKNQLFDALIASIHRHPLQWHLIITVAASADPTDNATIAWPPDRQRIDVGTLTIDRIESDDTSPARDINFDPLVLPNGMAASDDPLLSARSAVYSQSFTRREGEHKTPSPVSPAEIAGHE